MLKLRNPVQQKSSDHTFLVVGLTVTVHVCGDFVLERGGADDGSTGPTQIMQNLSHGRWEARPVFKEVTQRIRRKRLTGRLVAMRTMRAEGEKAKRRNENRF